VHLEVYPPRPLACGGKAFFQIDDGKYQRSLPSASGAGLSDSDDARKGQFRAKLALPD
jgi:hypothetical protein